MHWNYTDDSSVCGVCAVLDNADASGCMIESPVNVKEMYEFAVQKLKEQLQEKTTELQRLKRHLGEPALNQAAP